MEEEIDFGDTDWVINVDGKIIEDKYINFALEPGEVKVMKIMSGDDDPDWCPKARNELVDVNLPRYKYRMAQWNHDDLATHIFRVSDG